MFSRNKKKRCRAPVVFRIDVVFSFNKTRVKYYKTEINVKIYLLPLHLEARFVIC